METGESWCLLFIGLGSFLDDDRSLGLQNFAQHVPESCKLLYKTVFAIFAYRIRTREARQTISQVKFSTPCILGCAPQYLRSRIQKTSTRYPPSGVKAQTGEFFLRIWPACVSFLKRTQLVHNLGQSIGTSGKVRAPTVGGSNRVRPACQRCSSQAGGAVRELHCVRLQRKWEREQAGAKLQVVRFDSPRA